MQTQEKQRVTAMVCKVDTKVPSCLLEKIVIRTATGAASSPFAVSRKGIWL